jgi:antitoxin VapB
VVEALVVEDSEAAALARELAERRGVSVEEAVVASLRETLAAAPPPPPAEPRPIRVPTLAEMTPEQRARYESLRALVREAGAFIRPGATSDHSDLYDEFGLPI